MPNEHPQPLELGESNQLLPGIQGLVEGFVDENEAGLTCVGSLVELPAQVMYLVFLEIVNDILSPYPRAPVISDHHEAAIVSRTVAHEYQTRIYYLRTQLNNYYKCRFC
jgi:hypothetical protein